jgi:16S rRNA (adenine1518-N6/adenine1519-N6)-dimethyltransferase
VAVFARKRFGQHFLHDQGVVERIVEALAPHAEDALVEIGPGRGALTDRLAQGPFGTLDLIELDRDLAALQRERQRGAAQVTLHEQDALKFDFAALSGARGRPLRVVGNLPYNVSTPLLFHLLGARAAIADLHVMLQKEVVDRIVAAPDTGDYGRLTVMLAPWIVAQRLFDVGPGAFRPPPRVWSSVVRLDVRQEPAFAVDARFGRVVLAAFTQRRKTLRNALRTLMTAEAIAACGIDPAQRPETLTPEQFAQLARVAPSG